MRRSIFILFLLISENFLAQDYINLVKPNEVATILYLEKRDVIKYRCHVENLKFKNGNSKPKSSQVTNYDLLLKVVESTDSSYVFELTYANVKREGENETVSEIQAELLKSFSIQYCTDELGAYDSIINKKELIETSLKCLTVFSEKINGDYAQILNGIKKIIADEENIEALFIEDINMIHNLYGIQAKLNNQIEFELEYPALVGISMNGIGKFQVTNIDLLKGNCALRLDQVPNKDELVALIQTISLQLGRNDFDDSPTMKLTSNLNVSYKMDLSNGKMEQIKSKQTIRLKSEDKEIKKVITKLYTLQ